LDVLSKLHHLRKVYFNKVSKHEPEQKKINFFPQNF
jgi:hypothetical protein